MRGGWGWMPPGPSRIVHAFGAQGFDAAAERGAAGQGGVDEREHDGRDAQAGGLGEDAEGVGVADALGPLVDGVVGGRGDEDGVGDEGPGRAGSGVLAADRAAGLVLRWRPRRRSRARPGWR